MEQICKNKKKGTSKTLWKYLDQITFQGHHPIGPINHKLSHGPYIVTKEGKRYYDATSYWNTMPFDADPERYPELKRIVETAGMLAIQAPTMSEMATEEQWNFVKMMKKYWAPLHHLYTFSEGARGVMEACWIAASLVAEREGFMPTEAIGVSFEHGFHGRYDRAGDATYSSPKVAFRQNPDRVIHCPSPTMVFDEFGNVLKEETKRAFEQSMDHVEQAFQNPKTAYVITEYPFQAEGGALLLAPQTLKTLYHLCKRYGKLLIVDCVQMGGRVWAKNEHGVISPFPSEVLKYADIITFGKIFRVCGFMSRDPLKLDRGFKEDVMSTHPERLGSTWVGRAEQCLIGVVFIKIIKKYRLWRNAIQRTEYALNTLKKMTKMRIILSPRGRPKDTAYLGWDLPDRETRDKFVKLMREKHHILIREAGERSIRWAPCLDISSQETFHVLNAIENVQSLLAKK